MSQTNLVPLGDLGRRPRKYYHCPVVGCAHDNSALGAIVPDCPIHQIPMREVAR
jgi:hypothetical protein